MKLDTLFKKTSTGAIQTWTISVEDSTIVTTWGQSGGSLQTTRDLILDGKNVGKKNATTPAEQARLEAQARWTLKLKKGYTKTADSAESGETDEIITGGISPMLAHRFDEQGHKLQFPCLSQPKLDGHRCLAVVEKDGVSLWSRTRKPINSVPHINAAVMALGLLPGTKLDGELYNHDYRNKFEELTSFIRSSSPKTGHEVVEFHVYDVVSLVDDPQFKRWETLEIMFSEVEDDSPLKLVETLEIEDEDALMLAFEDFLEEGYEGAMARNLHGKYVNKRSYDLLKIKEFLDAEFPVKAVEEGRGKLAGHAIFVCTTPDGTEFRAKLKGATVDLKQYFDDPTLAVGRQLTVKYQGLTKNGIPRFPVALRFATAL